MIPVRGDAGAGPLHDPAAHGGEHDGLQALLHRLALRAPSPWPFLSVYLNTRALGGGPVTFRPFLKKSFAEAMLALPERSPERESLRVDVQRVQDHLDYELADSTRAVAFFACFGEDDLFEAVQLPRPVAEQAVRVGPLPWLWPLLVVADHAQRVAVLVSDTHAARLFVLAFGRIEIRREVRSPLTSRTRSAGEADPQHAQRHADETRKKHARLAVATLEEMARESGATWLVVAGEEVILPELGAALSHEARARLLVPVEPMDVRVSEADLGARVDELLEARESAQREELARRVADPAQNGRTACGLDATLAAVRAARAAEVVISTAFPAERPGWSCQACHAFGHGATPGSCPECGRATVHATSLRDVLGHAALASGARVRFVEPLAVPAFDACGGVGALLRYL